MPIQTTEYRNVPLDQRRSSAIVPADTYFNQPPPDQGKTRNAEQFAKAASALGSSLENLGGQLAAQQEKEDLLKVDDYVAQIRSEAKDGVPLAVQAEPFLADKSTTVRARVNESLGHEDGINHMAKLNEQFMQETLPNGDPIWTNPEATRAWIDSKQGEALSQAKSQPFYGGAFSKSVTHGLNAIEQQAQARRSGYYQQRQGEDFLRQTIDGSDAAVKEHSEAPVTPQPAAPVGVLDGKVVQGGPAPTTPVGPPANINAQDAITAVTHKIIGHESGGNPTAQNSRSSAGGLGQFIDSTWVSTVRKYRPDLAPMSNRQILSMKKSTTPEGIALQKEMVFKFTESNAELVKQTGAPVTPGNIYLMHFAGEQGGRAILKASDGTRIEQVLGADAIAANPFLRGKSVGEVKQWASKVMGQKYDPTKAAQNFIREKDREWGASSGIGNVYRRDVLAKGLADYAMKTGDASYLDRMPPELMTPSIQADFAHARKVAEDVSWSRTQRQHQLETEQRQETSRLLVGNMMDKVLKGEEINPGLDTRRPDGTVDEHAFNFAQTHQDTLNLPQAESMANRENYSDQLETAAVSGDWSKVLSGWDGQSIPAASKLRDEIVRRKDMRTEDKKYLLSHIDKIMAVGQVTNSPDAKAVFKGEVDTYATVLMNQMLTKTMNGLAQNPIDFKGEAQQFFNTQVRMRLKAAIEANGGNTPSLTDRNLVLSESAKATREHIKELGELYNKGDKSGGEAKPAAKPAEPKESTGSTVKAAEIPANVPVINMGGRRFVKVNGPDGKIVVKEVKD
jgi:hypothetical protein